MKKKIIRLRRWLDRLSRACEGKQWSSAVAASDCLNAEARELREELYGILIEDSHDFRFQKILSTIPLHIKTIGIALLIVSLTSIPIATESENMTVVSKVSSENSFNKKNLSWLSKEEAELLTVFRSNFAEGSSMALTPLKTNVNTSVNHKNNAKQSDQKEQGNSKEELFDDNLKSNAQESKNKSFVKTTVQDDLLSLIQVGERALRGDSFGIKVVK